MSASEVGRCASSSAGAAGPAARRSRRRPASRAAASAARPAAPAPPRGRAAARTSDHGTDGPCSGGASSGARGAAYGSGDQTCFAPRLPAAGCGLRCRDGPGGWTGLRRGRATAAAEVGPERGQDGALGPSAPGRSGARAIQCPGVPQAELGHPAAPAARAVPARPAAPALRRSATDGSGAGRRGGRRVAAACSPPSPASPGTRGRGARPGRAAAPWPAGRAACRLWRGPSPGDGSSERGEVCGTEYVLIVSGVSCDVSGVVMLVWCHGPPPLATCLVLAMLMTARRRGLPAGSPRYRQLIAQHPDPVTR